MEAPENLETHGAEFGQVNKRNQDGKVNVRAG